MKRNPTRKEMQAIQKANPNLNVQNWLVRKSLQGKMELEHKATGTRKWVAI